MSNTLVEVSPLLPPLVLRKQSHRSIDTPCTWVDHRKHTREHHSLTSTLGRFPEFIRLKRSYRKEGVAWNDWWLRLGVQGSLENEEWVLET